LDLLKSVVMSGAAPYFHFDAAISSIGAPLGEKLDYFVYFDKPDSKNAADLGDDRGAVQFYIRAGSDTAMLSSDWYDPHAAHHSDEPVNAPTITVTEVSGDRVELQFGGPIGPPGDNLYACAIVFRNGDKK